MSRHRLTRHGLAVLILVLRGSHAAIAAPNRATPAARTQPMAAATPRLAAAWHWFTELLASNLSTVRGDQGSGVVTDGEPASAGTLSIVTADEGSMVDPDGHH